MISLVKISPSAEVITFVGRDFTADRLGQIGKEASERASSFLRMANMLDALEHNTTGRSVPSIMEAYAKNGEVLEIRTLSARKRIYTLGLLTITEED